MGALASVVWAPALILGAFAGPLAWARVPGRQAAVSSALYAVGGAVLIWAWWTLGEGGGLWTVGVLVWLVLAGAGALFSFGLGAVARGWRGLREDPGRAGEREAL